ncbi:DUF3192 domain-containing protein [Desulfosudis oleivorans]|uniref:DUF3192 domain-containing protein n=1 Tax=Desulfosudis oleivorans (strain DSM 6200 / JCM 39069 / Hxd3) TaxID=96561 RepID=A8ZTS4_DESOH|nr:DUF3192 domain-containing protein [Desulfosudis oleivorans]ABW67857.1 hypothetical protein Dole_2053 [Desulfosudis oleivorans Hxd3]
MMKKILILIAIAILLCSCTPALVKTNSNLITLKPGMAQDDVTAVMGVPVLSELYEAADGKMVSILYYRTEEKKTTVLSAKEECTPVVFINGKLVGWGDRLTASGINLLKVKTR